MAPMAEFGRWDKATMAPKGATFGTNDRERAASCGTALQARWQFHHLNIAAL
jgi:hypothetical protein